MKGRDKLIESSEKGHKKESTNPGKDTDQKNQIICSLNPDNKCDWIK
jgi:hypothetical protein